MTHVVQQLIAIQKEFPFREKILLVPNHGEGFSMMESMNSEGHPTLNMRPRTLVGLVEADFKEKAVTTDLLDHLVWEIMTKLQEKGRLSYFHQHPVSYSLACLVRSALETLRGAYITPCTLPLHAFETREKGLDLIEIFSCYEKEREAREYLDYVDLLTSAKTQYATREIKQVFILALHRDASKVEEDFFQTLARLAPFYELKDLTIWNAPYKRERLVGLLGVESKEECPSPFAYLYAVQDNPTEKPFLADFYRAYGVSNEVREVLRRVLEKEILFDEVLVLTTNDSYHKLFYDLSLLYAIPMTFAQGLPITNFRPGRLIVGLLHWIRRDYPIEVLVDLIRGGLFFFEEEERPSNGKIIRILRRSEIIEGRSRYLTWEPKAEEKEEQWVLAFLQKLMENLPEVDEKDTLSYSDLISWLLESMKTYAATSSENDARARKTLLLYLEELLQGNSPPLSALEAVQRLLILLESMRVGHSNPKPGHLHVGSCDRIGYWPRKHVFVLGLDGNSFPGGTREDPILLDCEREKISLPIQSKAPLEKTHTLIQHLAGLSGSFVFSCSVFDTLENREQFPCSFLLQVYRLHVQDNTVDYSGLTKALGEIVSFAPVLLKNALGELESWLTHFFDGLLRNNQKEVLSHFKGLQAGLFALAKRSTGLLNAFTGKVHPFLELSQWEFSASKLEALGRCPYSFFLRYVLNLKPLETASYETHRWLDPLMRGTLLHAIYEDFYRALLVKKELPDRKKHQALLEDVVADNLSKMAQKHPIPNPAVYQAEASEIYASSFVFLRQEERHARSLPLELEYTLGSKTARPAIALSLHRHSLLIGGRMDRIDPCEDGIAIWDYKTGGTYGYSEHAPLQGGRRLQHGIYALVAQQLGFGSVSSSGYLFSSVKGEGQRMVYPYGSACRVKEVLDDLLDLVVKGLFFCTDSVPDCKFCDYDPICEMEYFAEYWEKIHGSAEPLLEGFKGVRACE